MTPHWIDVISTVATAVAADCAVLFIPVAVVAGLLPKWRKFSGNVFIAVSSLTLLATSLFSLVLTLNLCGWWAVIVGLLFVGVGINAVSVVATLATGHWPDTVTIAVCLASMFVLRVIGCAYLASYDQHSVEEF